MGLCPCSVRWCLRLRDCEAGRHTVGLHSAAWAHCLCYYAETYIAESAWRATTPHGNQWTLPSPVPCRDSPQSPLSLLLAPPSSPLLPQVKYLTDEFLTKNMDAVVPEHSDLLAASSQPFVVTLFPPDMPSTPGSVAPTPSPRFGPTSASTFASIGRRFKVGGWGGGKAGC